MEWMPTWMIEWAAFLPFLYLVLPFVPLCPTCTACTLDSDLRLASAETSKERARELSYKWWAQQTFKGSLTLKDDVPSVPSIPTIRTCPFLSIEAQKGHAAITSFASLDMCLTVVYETIGLKRQKALQSKLMRNCYCRHSDVQVYSKQWTKLGLTHTYKVFFRFWWLLPHNFGNDSLSFWTESTNNDGWLKDPDTNSWFWQHEWSHELEIERNKMHVHWTYI